MPARTPDAQRIQPIHAGFSRLGVREGILLKSLSCWLGSKDGCGIRRFGYKYEGKSTEGGYCVAHQIRTVLARRVNEAERHSALSAG